MYVLRAALGLGFFILLAWLLSSHRRRFPWRVVIGGLIAQVLLALLVLRTELGQRAVGGAAAFVHSLIGMARPGAELVFGPLANPAAMGEVFGPGGSFVFAFAGTGLVVIIFFSALMAVLYHLGVMQVLVYLMAKLMTRVLGVSGAESLAMAANVFVGQTEAPLVVRPYVERMTRSELNALMCGGFATIAGSVLAVYMGILGADYAPHLLTASVMSAPAAFLIAKVMQPETQETVTGDRVELRIERTSANLVEAAATGTTVGLKLYLNVIAMLIAFLGLVAVIDWPLGALGQWLGMTEALTLQGILGLVFAPVAWMMGIEGWHDSRLFGSLLGTKLALNEFVALDGLSRVLPGSEGAAFANERSAMMAAYALCGFANIGSVGIQLGGITPLAPGRRTEISQLALRAMLGGAFASFMTATIAGAMLS